LENIGFVDVFFLENKFDDVKSYFIDNHMVYKMKWKTLYLF